MDADVPARADLPVVGEPTGLKAAAVVGVGWTTRKGVDEAGLAGPYGDLPCCWNGSALAKMGGDDRLPLVCG